MSNVKDKPKSNPRVEVVLEKAHEHAGKQYKPGEKISVTEIQRDWLKRHGIIK